MAKVPRNLLPSRRSVANTFNQIVAGTAKPPSSKIGPVEGITDRTIAKPATTVSAEPGLGDNRTQVDTYFTAGPRPGEPTPQIYTANRFWARVTLTLETAGPVAVGTSSKLFPVLGGSGRLLQTGVPITFTIAKGSILYIASTGVNRVGRAIEPIPWLEQISGILSNVVSAVLSLATGKK